MNAVRQQVLLARAAMVMMLGSAAQAQLPNAAARPRPAFVEMMPGATEVTGSFFKNALREGGMVLAATEKPEAEVLAYYKGSMQKHGLTPGQQTVTPKNVVLVKGLSGDSKRELRLEVNPGKGGRVMFQLNFVVNK
jgi:hypothetical protein